MKLYDVPRNTRIKVLDDGDIGYEETYAFHHIDGMYSYCTTDKGEVVHLFAGTEVEIVPDKE